MATARTAAGSRQAKLGQDSVSMVSIRDIRPSPENDQLYRPILRTDPDIKALAESIRKHGVREPIVISRDGFILSGHRRFAAAKLAGLKQVPCRVEPISRVGDPDRFLVLLREYNRQREKSFDETLREELVSMDPDEAYQALIEHREERAHVDGPPLALRERKRRCAISAAKRPFLQAIQRQVEALRPYWPLSDRLLHYKLLNEPPPIHASKRKRYENTPECYKALVELLTRARLTGKIPWAAIADVTRPVTTWQVHSGVQAFLRQQLDDFLKGYYRDLQCSQPNHIELLVEKNTVEPIIRPVAARYRIPVMSGRGFSSLPPRRQMAQRFQQSGKEKLILLMVTDHDPDGEEIAHSFARSMRDDFGISNIHPRKVALTPEQVQEFDLRPEMKAKQRSTNYRRFADHHGDNVFELEALDPSDLQRVVADAIDEVLDVEAFNREIDAEKTDAHQLMATRQAASKTLGPLGEGHDE